MQTASAVHPASYKMGAAVTFIPGKGVKESGMTTQHRVQSRVRMCGDGYSTIKYTFTVWGLIKHKDNFTYTLSLLNQNFDVTSKFSLALRNKIN
jgi:hypothetical protein